MDSRTDRLAEQKAQVALVFQKMLGMAAARAYLTENGFTESAIVRILGADATQRRSVPAGAERSVTWRGSAKKSAGPSATIERRWRERKLRTLSKKLT